MSDGETPDESITVSEIEDATAPASAGPRRRGPNWFRGGFLPVAAAALLLASAVAAASVYWWLYRPDRLTDDAARQQVVAAAKGGTEAILTYSPENLDADLAEARSHLTEPFLGYYSDFTERVVSPAARDKGVKTEANVARAGISQIRPGRAEVLVFVNQVTTSKDRPTPALATSSVLVTLVNADGRWLISDFKPI